LASEANMKKRYANKRIHQPQTAQDLRAFFGFTARGTCGSALSPQRGAASPKKRVNVRIRVQVLPDFAFDKNPVIVNINDASNI
jgi:hypothetical protein